MMYTKSCTDLQTDFNNKSSSAAQAIHQRLLETQAFSDTILAAKFLISCSLLMLPLLVPNHTDKQQKSVENTRESMTVGRMLLSNR